MVSDDAIVLSVRARMAKPARSWKLLTREHGRHLGLVRGGASRESRPLLQPGNSVARATGARGCRSIWAVITVELAQRPRRRA